jgi:predicted transcriptional regulator
MARCDHKRGNIQQYTEICLDCGHNVYETDEEYYRSLLEEKKRLMKNTLSGKIEKLEAEIEELRKQQAPPDEDY